MEPFRDTYWNVPIWAKSFLYISAVIVLMIMGWGLYRRIRLWARGMRLRLPGFTPERLRRLWTYALVQVRVRRQRYAGLMHLAIFWGCLLLFAGTVLSSLDHYLFQLLAIKLLKGPIYLTYELILDLAGLALLAGLAMAIYRRYVQRPRQLDGDIRFALTLVLLSVIGLSGFLVEGLRLLATQPSWAAWSPVGYLVAWFLGAVGISVATARSLHLIVWIAHMAVAMLGLAAIPYLNLLHLVTSPLNIVFSRLSSKGALSLVEDLTEAPTIGAGWLENFSWLQLLELDACTECGRCQEVCPAWQAEQPLSPKRMILDLRHYLSRDGSLHLSAIERTGPVIGQVIKPEALWACTTCRACVEICPVLIDPLGFIVEMRRYVVDQGEIPVTAARSLEDTLTLGSAWAQPPSERARWAEDLGLRVARPGNEVSLLYWIGDVAAYDIQAQEIPRALTKILKLARLDPTTLGPRDGSDGEAARRLGEEGLFQIVAKANIEQLRQVSPERILTHCPHAYNTLRNEYPQLDGAFHVVHHSQLLLELLQSGRIRPTWELQKRVTYHDPCYLGRYNDVYDAPREVLRSLPGLELVEMERCREDAFCCGGGGGLMWLDVESGQRVNYLRFEEVEALEVDVIVTACPYCKIMLHEAAVYKGSRVQVKDLAELVLEARPEAGG